MQLNENVSKFQFPVASKDKISALDFKQVSESEVNKIILSLINSKAKDSWGLNAALVKQHKEHLIAFITHIINRSVEENADTK